MDFWDRLEEVRDRNDVLRHPFYVRWSAGELTLDELDAVGGGNEFGHGGLGKEISVALDGVAVHKRVGREWAGVDVGDDEGLEGTRGLSVRRDGENREKDENCSHQVSLRLARIDC